MPLPVTLLPVPPATQPVQQQQPHRALAMLTATLTSPTLATLLTKSKEVPVHLAPPHPAT
jgi:hypothetical protein